MSATDEVTLRSLVLDAFRTREKPVLAFVSRELTSDEKESVDEIFRKRWEDVTASDWEKHFDVISFLSPEAFCYYLPGLIDSCVRERRPHMVAVSTVLSMLDRSPDIELWDDLFSMRWMLLTFDELVAIEAWVVWLASAENLNFDEIGLLRAFENLELLKGRKAQS